MSTRSLTAVAAMLFAATSVSSLHAQEVIANGGFEAGLAG